MALKDVAEQVRKGLKPDEEFKGAFIANCMPTLFWFFMIGPFAAVMMKQYLITVTDKRLYFTRLDMFQKPMVTDDFEYGQINIPLIKGKFFSRTVIVNLQGKKLKLTIPFRKTAAKNILDPELLEFIKGRFT